MCVCVCEKGVYQYFHVCFRVEARRDESLVLCELVQHGLTQDGLYNGGGGRGRRRGVGRCGEGRRWR